MPRPSMEMQSVWKSSRCEWNALEFRPSTWAQGHVTNANGTDCFERSDPNPRVRVEAMRALSRIPTAESAALVLEAAMKSPGESGAINARGEEKGGQFDKPTFSDTKDPHYGYAAWLSINDLAKPWTDAIASGAWKADTAERQQQLAWGLRAIDPALAGATHLPPRGRKQNPARRHRPVDRTARPGRRREGTPRPVDRLIAAQLPGDARAARPRRAHRSRAPAKTATGRRPAPCARRAKARAGPKRQQRRAAPSHPRRVLSVPRSRRPASARPLED